MKNLTATMSITVIDVKYTNDLHACCDLHRYMYLYFVPIFHLGIVPTSPLLFDLSFGTYGTYGAPK